MLLFVVDNNLKKLGGSNAGSISNSNTFLKSIKSVKSVKSSSKRRLSV